MLRRLLRSQVVSRSLARSFAVSGGEGCATRFPGAITTFTSEMKLQPPQSKRDVYRVMNEQAQMLRSDYKLKVPPISLFAILINSI
jgi:hypothetical protein